MAKFFAMKIPGLVKSRVNSEYVSFEYVIVDIGWYAPKAGFLVV
jgi:hypothetical protein